MTKKIVVVDDELDMRLFISTILETNGYKAITAKNGEQGLQKVKEIFPALIILDVMMPGEGGAKMYKRLRDDDAINNIPVIMMTAVDEKAFYHYLKMLDLQSSDPIQLPQHYHQKPPDPEKLIKTIEQLLL